MENETTNTRDYERYFSKNIKDTTDEQYLRFSNVESLVVAKQTISNMIKQWEGKFTIRME